MIHDAANCFELTGQIRWRGELEQYGRDLVASLRESLPDNILTPVREQDIRSYFRLLDRRGAFAWGVDLSQRGKLVRHVTQQLQATDVLTLQRTIDQVVPHEVTNQPGTFGGRRGLVSYQRSAVTTAVRLEDRMVAESDRIAHVRSDNVGLADQQMEQLIDTMGQPTAPEGPSGIMLATVYAHQLFDWLRIRAGLGAADIAPIDLPLAAQLRVHDATKLEIIAEIPATALLDTMSQTAVHEVMNPDSE